MIVTFVRPVKFRPLKSTSWERDWPTVSAVVADVRRTAQAAMPLISSSPFGPTWVA